MLDEEPPGARVKLREAEGWLKKARAEGWYEPDDEVDGCLRSSTSSSAGTTRTGSRTALVEEVLSTATSRTPAACGCIAHRRGEGVGFVLLAERDCDYVATDILVDPQHWSRPGCVLRERRRPRAADVRASSFDDASQRRLLRRDPAPTRSTCGGWFARWTVSRATAQSSRGSTREREGCCAAREPGAGGREGAPGSTSTCTPCWRTRPPSHARASRAPDGALGRLAAVPFGYFLSRVPRVGMTTGTLAHLSAGRYAGVSIIGRRR